MKSTTTRLAFALASVVALLSFAPAAGQNSEETPSTLTGIEGVAIFVDSVSTELFDGGIRSDNLAAEVERVLREEGIAVLKEHSDPVPGSPTLYVEVVAVMQEAPEMVAFSVRMELMQTVLLERAPEEESRLLTTWGTGGTGLYGREWRTALIDDVVVYAQEFAAAYWAANPDWLE